MGLRLGKFGAGPEVGDRSIRFGWDYQFEHEHGLSVDLSTARFTTLLGLHVLVLSAHRLDDDMLLRIWEREGTKDDAPVWVLWKEDVAVLFFRDLDLATTVEMAVVAGRAQVSYEPRIREGRAIRGNEGVLSWTPES